MRYTISLLSIVLLVLVFSFRPNNSSKIANEIEVTAATSIVNEDEVATLHSEEAEPIEKVSVNHLETPEQALQFVGYAKTLIGTPYLYGSTDPGKGLDCSGFVNCVSDHFGIDVPRSSVDFTDYGETIAAGDARPGDLILFTGTDPSKLVVGHIGIIIENVDGELQFIHSSSGKAKGVTISGLDDYYKTRFVKVIRIFPTAGDKTAA